MDHQKAHGPILLDAARLGKIVVSIQYHKGHKGHEGHKEYKGLETKRLCGLGGLGVLCDKARRDSSLVKRSSWVCAGPPSVADGRGYRSAVARPAPHRG